MGGSVRGRVLKPGQICSNLERPYNILVQHLSSKQAFKQASLHMSVIRYPFWRSSIDDSWISTIRGSRSMTTCSLTSS
eukprot:12922908-Prorocentrum_lima.AAC.1